MASIQISDTPLPPHLKKLKFWWPNLFMNCAGQTNCWLPTQSFWLQRFPPTDESRKALICKIRCRISAKRSALPELGHGHLASIGQPCIQRVGRVLWQQGYYSDNYGHWLVPFLSKCSTFHIDPWQSQRPEEKVGPAIFYCHSIKQTKQAIEKYCELARSS